MPRRVRGAYVVRFASVTQKPMTNAAIVAVDPVRAEIAASLKMFVDDATIVQISVAMAPPTAAALTLGDTSFIALSPSDRNAKTVVNTSYPAHVGKRERGRFGTLIAQEVCVREARRGCGAATRALVTQAEAMRNLDR